MKTLIIIPTYCEAENIGSILTAIRSAAPEADVLVVDDSSPDGTADLVRDAGQRLGQIEALSRPGKGGLGAAYRAGFEYAFARGYEVVVQMDADFSHDPAALPSLLAAVDAGAPVAVGSRYVSGGSTPDWPLRRRMLSKMGNRYASTLLDLDVHDATSGYRAYRAEVLGALRPEEMQATGYGFQLELSYRARLHDVDVTEVPIAFKDRRHGTSKMSGSIVAEAIALITWWAIRDRIDGRLRRPGSEPVTPDDDRIDLVESDASVDRRPQPVGAKGIDL